MGDPPPWTPRLPILVGLGFARVLGPTRGGVANVGSSPPLLNLWGDTPPRPPARGLRPLALKFGLFEKGLEKGGWQQV